MNLIVKNGRVIDPATGRDKVEDVYIRENVMSDAFPGSLTVLYFKITLQAL